MKRKINLLEAHGNFPQTIYRVFDDIKYADAFINRSIRFSRLQNYKYIEDVLRNDDSEGESHVIHNRSNYHSSFASNVFYILCFHRTLEAAKQSNFGKFIVEINNPRKLAIELTKWLEKQPYKHFGGIEGVNIEYSYGEEVDIKPTAFERSKLTYSQKPNSYRNEDEFRFVFIRKSCNEPYIFIDIDKAEELCKMIV